MMNQPSIDDLEAKMPDGNKYILCNLISKRARNIESVRGSELAGSDKKAITIACEEIVAGKVKPSEIVSSDDNL